MVFSLHLTKELIRGSTSGTLVTGDLLSRADSIVEAPSRKGNGETEGDKTIN